MKACPFCAEQIQDAAIICRFCNRDLPKPVGAPETSSKAASPAVNPRAGVTIRPAAKVFFMVVGVIVLAFVGLFGALLLVGLSSASRSGTARTEAGGVPSSSASTEERADIAISASQLVAAYKENEVAADSRFKGKTIAVNGVIENIGKDILDTPYITLSGEPSDSFRNVQASFSRRDEGRLESLQKGQFITLQCRGKGLMMNVLLDRCSIYR